MEGAEPRETTRNLLRTRGQTSKQRKLERPLYCVTFGTFPTVLDLAHTCIQLKTFIHLTNGVVSDS